MNCRTQSRTIETLKTRAEFQRVRGGGRASTSAFVLEGKPRPPTDQSTSAGPGHSVRRAVTLTTGPRFGFTITKKVGNAVVRNRIRRRLRAALTEIADLAARPGIDYVVVARQPAAEQPFASLLTDLKTAFERVHAARTKAPPRGNPTPRGDPPPRDKTRPSSLPTDSKPDRKGVTEGSSPMPARSATSTHQSKSSRD